MGESIIKSGTNLGFPVDPLKISLPADSIICGFGAPDEYGDRMKYFLRNFDIKQLSDVPKPAGDITAVLVTIRNGAVYYCAESTKGQWICTTK